MLFLLVHYQLRNEIPFVRYSPIQIVNNLKCMSISKIMTKHRAGEINISSSDHESEDIIYQSEE